MEASSSSVFGTPGIGTGSVRLPGRASVTVAPVVISEGDVDLLSKQLSAQETMLRAAQDSVVALEERLAALKGLASVSGSAGTSTGAGVVVRGLVRDAPI
jgi:hypothetical protein